VAEEIRKGFHRDLDEVRSQLVRLGALTAEAVTRATDALLDADMVACQAIIDDDDPIDDLSQAIEDMCFRLLALQQPMAADLRTVAATMRINGDLERSADLAVNIAKGARRIVGHDLPPRLRGLLGQMGEEAVRMVRLAVDAYDENNAALGAALDDIDGRLDQLQREFVAAMFEVYADDRLALQPAVQLALVARYFERIGDHAVNTGERVWFMASGAPYERRPGSAGAVDPPSALGA
jgi:phosphate transport system protein